MIPMKMLNARKNTNRNFSNSAVFQIQTASLSVGSNLYLRASTARTSSIVASERIGSFVVKTILLNPVSPNTEAKVVAGMKTRS